MNISDCTKKERIRHLSNKEAHRITKEDICQALLALMADTPFEEITVTAIIRRSGVSRASFYRNYATKEAVMEDILSELSRALTCTIPSRITRETVGEWLQAYFQQLTKDASLPILLTRASAPCRHIFEEALCIQTGQMKCPAEEYMLCGFTSMLWSITNRWVQQGMGESPKQMAQIILALVNLPEQTQVSPPSPT